MKKTTLLLACLALGMLVSIAAGCKGKEESVETPKGNAPETRSATDEQRETRASSRGGRATNN